MKKRDNYNGASSLLASLREDPPTYDKWSCGQDTTRSSHARKPIKAYTDKYFWIYLVRVGKYPPRYWDFAGHIEKS